MIGNLFKKLGIFKTSALITILAMLLSAALFAGISLPLGKFRPFGLLLAVIIPIFVAPTISLFFLRVVQQLDVVRKSASKPERF